MVPHAPLSLCPPMTTAAMFLLLPLALDANAMAPTANAEPVCLAQIVIFTRAEFILVNVPHPVTTLCVLIAGTVNLCAVAWAAEVDADAGSAQTPIMAAAATSVEIRRRSIEVCSL